MTEMNDTLSYLASLSMPVIAAAGLIAGVWYRMENKVEIVRRDSATALHDVEKSLNEFKLKVAEEYASWETVRSIETRLTERMDALSEQVMKMPEAIADRMMKFLSLNSGK